MANSVRKPVVCRGRWLVAIVACCAMISACINTPLPDYYVLTPERNSVAQVVTAQVNPQIALGIGPVTIPETVNRPNIVTPLDSNQVEVAEYHRWSEPLIENISRVVITNIAGRLGLNKLYAYPWLGNPVDYQVRIDVLQMVGSPSESVTMQVRWQILTGEKPRQLILTRISEYTEATDADGYSAMVSAYSRAVASLSDDISKALSAIENNVSGLVVSKGNGA